MGRPKSKITDEMKAFSIMLNDSLHLGDKWHSASNLLAMKDWSPEFTQLLETSMALAFAEQWTKKGNSVYKSLTKIIESSSLLKPEDRIVLKAMREKYVVDYFKDERETHFIQVTATKFAWIATKLNRRWIREPRDMVKDLVQQTFINIVVSGAYQVDSTEAEKAVYIKEIVRGIIKDLRKQAETTAKNNKGAHFALSQPFHSFDINRLIDLGMLDTEEFIDVLSSHKT